jgi:endonuclease/exonuclease/phosphatase (EEP) superfamily protein YafD
MTAGILGAVRRGVPWLTVALALATLAALLGRLGWPFELFSHFRVQLLAAWLVLAVLLLALRLPRAGLVAVALAALQGYLLWPVPGVAPAAASCSGPGLTVVSANPRYTNAEHRRLLAWLRADPPDLLVVQELTPAWSAALEQGLPELAHGLHVPRADAYGIALLGAAPFASITALDLADDGKPSLRGRVTGPQATFEVLAVHARWPITPGLYARRNAALDSMAELARTAAVPLVLVGDLNLSAHSPDFARLLERSGLRDAAADRVWRPTWMAGFWPLALRIDHVLVSPGICVESVEVGPPIGSDHRPLRVRLRLAPASLSLR